ncbi:hypothetical protein LSH36_1367g00027 [Paralvinella palmiformis]|uniref:Neurotransmitter-gated ion-channel ligand-binding domain-containing protein n=1 Tax=Paralvinella palmiformis TaxID=53620 RepID=A0AAD9ITG1_9ANNE|nr:hypothetical protein LSH36_1367g00027 [Paralvinella palmiformis]
MTILLYGLVSRCSTLTNCADVFSPDVENMAVIFDSGTVLYTSSVSVTSSCSLDLRYFPFDQHTCQLEFGSWTYNGDTVIG